MSTGVFDVIELHEGRAARVAAEQHARAVAEELAARALPRQADTDDALLAVYTCIDAAHRAGRFHLADQILGCVEVDSVPVVVLLAYLSITHPAAEHLPSRWSFYKRVRHRILRERGAEETAAILRGLG